ncbi:MAG: HEPN domain-containing protein [Anaerolineales bacterium]|nr:HEPN domain-containing protein [Anaerolineales bacterium]
MNEVTSEWVFKAEQDFHSADSLLHAVDVPLAETASFHCQQCAEKYLKAFLQEHAIRFERKHDLLPLVALCAQVDDGFVELETDLTSLERYAVAIRYPGASASVKMAESAFDAAERVRSFVRGKLGAD